MEWLGLGVAVNQCTAGPPGVNTETYKQTDEGFVQGVARVGCRREPVHCRSPWCQHRDLQLHQTSQTYVIPIGNKNAKVKAQEFMKHLSCRVEQHFLFWVGRQ